MFDTDLACGGAPGPPLRNPFHAVMRPRGGGATASYASAAAEGSSIIDDDSLYQTSKKVKWAQDGQVCITPSYAVSMPSTDLT